jgi:hypothetical protein
VLGNALDELVVVRVGELFESLRVVSVRSNRVAFAPGPATPTEWRERIREVRMFLDATAQQRLELVLSTDAETTPQRSAPVHVGSSHGVEERRAPGPPGEGDQR